MSAVPYFKLNNDVEMPAVGLYISVGPMIIAPLTNAIGLGCWSGRTKEEWEQGQAWMATAVQLGYKHFNTASGYGETSSHRNYIVFMYSFCLLDQLGTEYVLARAIKEAGAKREDIFITTKLGYCRPLLVLVAQCSHMSHLGVKRP